MYITSCVKEYLSCLAGHYGPNVLLAHGGESVKRNRGYGEVYSFLRDAGKTVFEFSAILEKARPNPAF